MRRHAALLLPLLLLCQLILNAESVFAAPPVITTTTFSAVTTDSVRLEADINPSGKSALYHFEYGSADCVVSSCTKTPVPNGGIVKKETPERVKANVEGLTPGTTYHFRVVAKNGDGEVKGPDRTFTTRLPEPPFGPCPNDEPFRNQRPSGALPDCRAYEQATPVNKNGLDATGFYLAVKSSLSGEAVSFITASGTPASSGTQEPPLHASERGVDNWLTRGLLPPQSYGQRAGVIGWTPDFSHVFLRVTRFTEPETRALLDLAADGTITEVVPYTTAGFNFFFAGASADSSKAFFEIGPDPLGEEATPGKINVYAWERSSGQMSLVGVLPDAECGPTSCAPAGGSAAGPYDWVHGAANAGGGGAVAEYYTQEERAISNSGDSIYFTAGGGQLYRRLNPTSPSAETVRVSASEKTNGGGEGGRDINGARPAAFMGATSDGSTTFFTSSEKMTNNATTGLEPTEVPEIARADVVDGKNKQLNFLPARAYGVAVDGEYIYWANPTENAIGRAKLGGTEIKDKFIEVPEIEVGSGEFVPAHPQYVAVDGEHVYWTNAPDEEEVGERLGTIGRAKLEASGPKEIDPRFVTGASNPKGIAVNNEFIYWANDPPGGMIGNTTALDETRTIGRVKLNGSVGSVEENFIKVGEKSLERTPQGIAVNATNIYMAVDGTQAISAVIRYPLDGEKKGLKVFFEENQSKAKAGVRGLALDGKFVYWSKQGRNSIGRIDLELEKPEPEWIKEAAGPKGLAVNGEHIYWAANQDVLANPGNDLYRYTAAASAEGKHLSDLAVDIGDKNGAEVRGVLGISGDGSYVYFVANGVPDGVKNSPNGEGESATPGGGCQEVLGIHDGICNLYLWHEGEISFIARLGESDNANWSGTVAGVEVTYFHYQKPARVSADGRTLLFSTHRKLTAYENEGKAEFYRYVAGTAAPVCISCDPTGAPPNSVRAINIEMAILSNETIPAATLSRNLSADGKRVFFETTDALVAADVNGAEGCPIVGSEFQVYRACQDVYEWEAKGSGSCESEAQNGGCLYLISTGTSNAPSLFADASADGDDVLFFTRSALVRQDGDQLMDVYDARVGGGLAAQEAVQHVCGSEGECKEPSPPQPGFDSPGTAQFVGPGSPGQKRPKPCPKGRHRTGGKGKSRCVAKKRGHKGQKGRKGKREPGMGGRAAR
jgi:virginiamycin B lyase